MSCCCEKRKRKTVWREINYNFTNKILLPIVRLVGWFSGACFALLGCVAWYSTSVSHYLLSVLINTSSPDWLVGWFMVETLQKTQGSYYNNSTQNAFQQCWNIYRLKAHAHARFATLTLHNTTSILSSRNSVVSREKKRSLFTPVWLRQGGQPGTVAVRRMRCGWVDCSTSF